MDYVYCLRTTRTGIVRSGKTTPVIVLLSFAVGFLLSDLSYRIYRLISLVIERRWCVTRWVC